MQDFWLGCLYSLIGCLGFCFVYNLRGSVIIFSALGGAVGWAVYLAFAFTGNDILQFFLATVALSAYAEIMARIYKAPVTVFLIVALLPLVPGSGIYYTMEYCINGNLAMFAKEGLHTLFISGSLALGILIVSSVVRMFSRLGPVRRKQLSSSERQP